MEYYRIYYQPLASESLKKRLESRFYMKLKFIDTPMPQVVCSDWYDYHEVDEFLSYLDQNVDVICSQRETGQP